MNPLDALLRMAKGPTVEDILMERLRNPQQFSASDFEGVGTDQFKGGIGGIHNPLGVPLGLSTFGPSGEVAGPPDMRPSMPSMPEVDIDLQTGEVTYPARARREAVQGLIDADGGLSDLTKLFGTDELGPVPEGDPGEWSPDAEEMAAIERLINKGKGQGLGIDGLITEEEMPFAPVAEPPPQNAPVAAAPEKAAALQGLFGLDRDAWQSIMTMGLGMAASKRPDFAGAVGEAGLGALQDYSQRSAQKAKLALAERDVATKEKLANIEEAKAPVEKLLKSAQAGKLLQELRDGKLTDNIRDYQFLVKQGVDPADAVSRAFKDSPSVNEKLLLAIAPKTATDPLLQDATAEELRDIFIKHIEAARGATTGLGKATGAPATQSRMKFGRDANGKLTFIYE